MDKEKKVNINCMKKKRTLYRRFLFNPIFWIVCYLVCWMAFAEKYVDLLKSNPDALILTSDTVSKTKQIDEVTNYIKQKDEYIYKDFFMSGYENDYKKALEQIILKKYNFETTEKYSKIKNKEDLQRGITYTYSVPIYAYSIRTISDKIEFFKDNDSLFLHFQNNKLSGIGYEWANFYITAFASAGVRKWEIINKKETVLDIEDIKYQYCEISLNEKTIYIAVPLMSNVLEIYHDTNSLYDLRSILSESVIYVDDLIYKICDIQKQKPTKLDCYYFSAITITTTGYGDVLPNDDAVRICVTAEIVLGLVFMGLFLSALWQWMYTRKND